MHAAYRTVLGEYRAEIPKVKRSRFIATVAPLGADDDVAALVERLRGEFPDANHHCWAWRRGPAGEAFRYSDDGEPSGSAGRPILQRIDGLRLTDTVVVVTRIFGGTRLGVGGLIRAYGSAAAEGLAGVALRTLVPVRSVHLSFPLALSRRVEAILRAADVSPLEVTYGTSVQMRLEIPSAQAGALLDELRERGAGRISIQAPE